MRDQFARTRRLLGDAGMERLRRSRVAVFGLGGVGGFAAEALARSGVGALDLIDHDTVTLTNLNRQIIALHSTLGRYKADVMRDRIADINPDCRVTVHRVFYLPETRDQFDFSQYDYVADAIDTVAGKLALAEQARDAGVPVISAMGAGNKLDPTAFRAAYIEDTSVCPLARVMRAECRRRGIRRLKVVYSTEPPVTPLPDPEEEDVPGRRDVPGSVAFAPSAAGLVMASEIIRDLIKGADGGKTEE